MFIGEEEISNYNIGYLAKCKDNLNDNLNCDYSIARYSVDN